MLAAPLSRANREKRSLRRGFLRIEEASPGEERSNGVGHQLGGDHPEHRACSEAEAEGQESLEGLHKEEGGHGHQGLREAREHAPAGGTADGHAAKAGRRLLRATLSAGSYSIPTDLPRRSRRTASVTLSARTIAVEPSSRLRGSRRDFRSVRC